MAEALASAGARVALTARNAEAGRGRRPRSIASRPGPKTLGVAADVTRPADVEAMVARTLDTFGRLDILVNNAGINIRGPIEELTEDDWDQVIDTNLKGPWLCCRAAAEPMKAAEVGAGDQRLEHARRDQPCPAARRMRRARGA